MIARSYILEVETSVCISISVYEKSRSGLVLALKKAKQFMKEEKDCLVKIICSESKEEVWSNICAN